jgi:hypothetical protein
MRCTDVVYTHDFCFVLDSGMTSVHLQGGKIWQHSCNCNEASTVSTYSRLVDDMAADQKTCQRVPKQCKH